MNIKQIIFIIFVSLSLSACVVDPINAFKLSATNLQDRKMQSREYSDIKEESILAASAAVFQDMGYTLNESETRLGVVTASKDADATNGVQVFFSVLAALGGSATSIDDKQRFTATIVVLPRGNSGTYTARMTMQRVVWNTRGRVTRLESIKDKKVYRDFFEKLSKAVFLEKNT